KEAVNKKAKTYNSRDSPMVTHLTTSPPVRCLNIAEQTGCVRFIVLWSYVEELLFWNICIGQCSGLFLGSNVRSWYKS
ncbi:hypothetical protein K504DRAFT_367030, partial [Pleomassaria siparia CBS 279.74]